MPGVPQLVRRGQEGPGPLVAVALGQVAAAAEVLSGEGVPGGDHVPRRPPAGEVVEAGELAGYLIRLVERGVDRAGQPDVLGHRGQGGQDREGVGPADVVQLVPVDEPAGGHVADFRVVLPAVPAPAQHLHVVGRLVEVVGDQPLRARIGEAVRLQRRDLPAAEVGRGAGPDGDLDPDPGPAAAHVVQGGDGPGQVERLGMGGDGGRHEPDVPGGGGGPGRDQHRVEAAPDPVGAGVGRQAVVGLQVQAVLNGEEVQQAAFGVAGQLGPVTGGEQPLRLGIRLAPRGGMPASAVESDREMQGGRGRHHELRSGSDQGLPV